MFTLGTTIFLLTAGIICSQNMLQSSVAMAWSEVFEYWYSKRFNFKYGVMVPGSEQKIGAYTQV